jgi:hypothetical protein
MKKMLTRLMEYVRPVGIGLIIYCAYRYGETPAQRFAILGPFIVMLMAGTIAFEGLVLGKDAAEKIGYSGGRQYQRQSAFYSLAIALGALLAYSLQWGTQAYAAVTAIELVFLAFSAANHAYTAMCEKNFSRTNMMRPLLAVILIGYLVPVMLQALVQK